ncbi:hypothetical protein LUZ60_011293 [Juncus effusus]|nr:hypothetical protein LUZ60_011293 [Juncus effusus]
MKLTCLSEGTSLYNPPCHLLQLNGFSLLLECPIDLSSLLNFSPIPTSPCDYDNNNKLVRAVPFYKTVVSQWDPHVIDVVLISSPYSLLGLPFLTRKPGFSKSTKIYATEAIVKIGQLMMEDLISMHIEYLSFYGPDKNSDSPDLMNGNNKKGSEFHSLMNLYS